MKHAVYCATRNLYGDMETAAKSLVANSDVDRVHFLIEDAEFPQPLPNIVECHDVSGQEYFPPNGPNARSHWTWMVLMRAVLCHVLPDVGVVLSLDCDTVCTKDVSGVWDLPIDGCYFAAAKEHHKSRDGLLYTNFGVVLFNLDMLRDGKADEIVGVINSRRYKFPEQDGGNYLCQGRICEMPPEYNSMDFNGKAENPRITHFAAVPKDMWRKRPEVARYRDMSWEEAMALHERNVSSRPVLFVSNHSLERGENLRAVWDAYDGPKKFVKGVGSMTHISGHPVVVCDTLTPYIPRKDFKIVNIGHGITGDKLYGLDEQRPGIDPRALAQNDYVISTSTKTVDMAAGQFGIPADRALPLGMPRTDWYIGKGKGDGGTFMAKFERAYLYAPTFRGPNDGDRLPNIDWDKLDGLLEDDEILVVKRHYYTKRRLTDGDFAHIAEASYLEPSAPYLMDCDVLITDYSSIMFDAYVLGKPCVLDVTDMDAYLATRGMYFDYPKQYCSRCIAAEGNEEKLLAHLRAACVTGMRHTERSLIDKVADMCDGHSSERVCDLIRSLL